MICFQDFAVGVGKWKCCYKEGIYNGNWFVPNELSSDVEIYVISSVVIERVDCIRKSNGKRNNIIESNIAHRKCLEKQFCKPLWESQNSSMTAYS